MSAGAESEKEFKWYVWLSLQNTCGVGIAGANRHVGDAFSAWSESAER